jgi:hypothetical protein
MGGQLRPLRSPFFVTEAIRTVHGAILAMIAAAGILPGLTTSEGLAFHRIYSATTIGYSATTIGGGSKPLS